MFTHVGRMLTGILVVSIKTAAPSAAALIFLHAEREEPCKDDKAARTAHVGAAAAAAACLLI